MILLSVGPGMGALQTPGILREIAAAGHRTEVILEEGTIEFVGPAAFAGLSRVVTSPTETPEAIVFAPARSGTLARLAHGLGGNAAYELASSVRCAVVAPGLDARTASHPAIARNLEILRADGFRVVEGDGFGPEAVAAGVLGALGGSLDGVRLLVSAGGTREPIDSVRFLSNRSSGKMGVAIAREAQRRGAQVTVVAANVERAEPGVEWVPVETYSQLRDEVLGRSGNADTLVMAAAVSDFTPVEPAGEKIRRRERLTLELEATDDVLKTVCAGNPDLFVIGFAAVHGNPFADAREKLRSKGIDLVVGNDISMPGIGFGADENEVYVVGRGGEHHVPRASKAEVARAILDVMESEVRRERRV